MRARHGFSLLELAVVLVILAVILGFGVSIGQSAIEGSTRLGMQEKMAIIKKSLENYAQHNGYLPCPAAPALMPSAANYGRENRGAAGAGCDLTNGVVSASSVLYGAVPVFSLGLDESYMADAWGKKLTYMVSQPHIGTASSYWRNYTVQAATITVIGNGYSHTSSTTTADGSAPGAGATFAVISHGKNGAGAYLVNGTTIPTACPAATSLEYHNCSRAAASAGQVVDMAPNEGTQANLYFDDYVVWGSNSTWRTPIDLLPTGCSGTCEPWCAPCETGGRSASPGIATRLCAKFITRNAGACEARCIWQGAQSPCP